MTSSASPARCSQVPQLFLPARRSHHRRSHPFISGLPASQAHPGPIVAVFTWRQDMPRFGYISPRTTMDPTAAPAVAPTTRVKRHHWIVRLTHWLNAVAVARHDRERPPDLRRLPALRPRGDALPLPNPWDGDGFPEWARLGGWLAGGLNWHFALAWPFVITGLVYLALPRRSPGNGARSSSGHATCGPAMADAALLPAPAPEHPPQGKHNALQKAAYTFIVVLGRAVACSAASPSTSRSSSAGSRRCSAASSWPATGTSSTVWIFVAFTAAARGAGAAGRSGLAPRHDHRLVPREVSEP